MALFEWGEFTLHSGRKSNFRINCDSLEAEDWEALARLAVTVLPPFGSVEGVPRGGLALARALEPFVTEGPLLIVDDVCTSGRSLEEQRAGRKAIGLVVFARGSTPAWVVPLFWPGSWAD